MIGVIKANPAFFGALIIGSIFLSACKQSNLEPGRLLEIGTGPDTSKPEKLEADPSSTETGHPDRSLQEQAGDKDAYAKVDPSGQNLTFWHTYSPYYDEALNKIISGFNSSNPWGITVTAQNQGAPSDVYEKMLASLNTADAPDLVSAYQDQASVYHQAGGLVNIDELVNSPEWGLSDSEKSDFYPGIYNHDIFPTYENARLGFPVSRSMHVLYYNQDWLVELGYSSPPRTPVEFMEMACKATNQPFSKAPAGESAGYGLNLEASTLADWIFAHKGNIFNSEANQYSFQDEDVVETFQYLQELILKGCGVVIVEKFRDDGDFGAGKQLFAINSTSAMPYIRDAVESGAQFNWGVSAVPHTDVEPTQNTFGPSLSIVRSSPEVELAAWLFIKYFASPAVQAQWAAATGYFPVRRSAVIAMQQFLSENPVYNSGIDLLEYSQFEPPVPGYNFVREIVEEAMAAIMKGAEIKKILEELNDEANTILAEHQVVLEEVPPPAQDLEPGLNPIGSEERPIKLVFVPPTGVDTLVESSDQIEQALQEASGLYYEISVPSSYAAAVEEICGLNGDTVGFTPAMGYALGKKLCDVEPALSLYPSGWNDRFVLFITQRDNDIQSLKDLEGKKWGFSEVTSGSGFIYPNAILNSFGIKPGEQVETGSHTDTVNAVYQGEVDFGTTYFNPPITPEGAWNYGDPPDIPDLLVGECKSSEQGNLICGDYQVMDARQTIMDKAPDVIQKVRILDISKEIPNDTMSFSPAFPQDLQQIIVEAINAYVQSDACKQTLCSSNLFGWAAATPISDEHFEIVRTLMEIQGITLENIGG